MERTEAVDHKAEALRLIGLAADSWSKEFPQEDPPPMLDIQIALVHSNLAIAEGQERVAEEVRRAADALEAGSLAYTLEQARMRLRETFETSEWPQDGTDLEYFIRRAFPDAIDQVGGGQG